MAKTTTTSKKCSKEQRFKFGGRAKAEVINFIRNGQVRKICRNSNGKFVRTPKAQSPPKPATDNGKLVRTPKAPRPPIPPTESDIMKMLMEKIDETRQQVTSRDNVKLVERLKRLCLQKDEFVDHKADKESDIEDEIDDDNADDPEYVQGKQPNRYKVVRPIEQIREMVNDYETKHWSYAKLARRHNLPEERARGYKLLYRFRKELEEREKDPDNVDE